MRSIVFVMLVVLLSLASSTSQASETTRTITGNMAKSLYLALGGDLPNEQGDPITSFFMTNLSCNVQSETQQGDIEMEEETVSWHTCSFDEDDSDSGVWGPYAANYFNALRYVGVRLQGNEQNGRIEVKKLHCSKVPVQLESGCEGDETTIVQVYTCKITERDANSGSERTHPE